MARFYGSMSGQAKSEVTRRGNSISGVRAHVRGWDTGVMVEAQNHNGKDQFYIAFTGGSNRPESRYGFIWDGEKLVQTIGPRPKVKLYKPFKALSL
jgi:hypothetical protein